MNRIDIYILLINEKASIKNDRIKKEELFSLVNVARFDHTLLLSDLLSLINFINIELLGGDKL